MFLPSILIEGVQNDITRFVIGHLSISQLIYLSEVGGVILGSKIPVSIGKLFMIFLIQNNHYTTNYFFDGTLVIVIRYRKRTTVKIVKTVVLLYFVYAGC